MHSCSTENFSKLERHFHSDRGQNKKQKRKWRFLEWQWVLCTSKVSLPLSLNSGQFQVQTKQVLAKWLLKHYFMLLICSSFFHKFLSPCWHTVSYSLTPPCPCGMRRNTCGWQALKSFSPRPYHWSMINKACRNNSKARSAQYLAPKS